MLHFMRCGTVLMLSNASGLRTQTISSWLKKLETEGFVRKLGWAQTDPSSGLAGTWWIPSRKAPPDCVNRTPLQAIVRTLSDSDARQTRCVKFETNVSLRTHEMEVAHALARLMKHHRNKNLPGEFESETYLRTVRLWTGAPRSPAQYAKCHIVSVPDVRVADNSWTVNVEVESSIKSTKEYRRYVELAEEGVVVLWVVQDSTAGKRLTSALEQAGWGKVRGHLPCTWDQLENAFTHAVKVAKFRIPLNPPLS